MKTIKKYRGLMPIVLCIAAAVALPQLVLGAFVLEKLYTMTDAVNVLAASIDADPQKSWAEHELGIIDSVEYLDRLEQVYACAFKLVSGKPVQITERFYETSPFEPFDYPAFTEAASELDYGHVRINYAPLGQGARDIHVYFRWMPLYSGAGERYLVIVGVSKHSIVSNAYAWLSIRLWVMVAAAAAPTVRRLFIAAENGNATDADGGEYRDGGRSRSSRLKRYG